MRKLFMMTILLLAYTVVLKGQEEKARSDAGIGVGINYGGIGSSVSFPLTKSLSIEGFCGYNLLEIVGGGAINVYIIPKNNIKTYRLALKGMYGYNAVVIKSNNSSLNLTGNDGKTFYGFTFGFVNEFRFGHSKTNGINIGILLPIRTNAFDAYNEDLEDTGYDIENPRPVLFSIGFHMEIKRQ